MICGHRTVVHNGENGMVMANAQWRSHNGVEGKRWLMHEEVTQSAIDQ